MKSKLLLAVALLLAGFGAISAKKVHTIGDSTMANYTESATVTRGWGMYFGLFLTDGWTSVNYAQGGRDSRGGYKELWQNAKPHVEAGDYVLIQFAHNDEKIQGVDRDELYDYYISKGMTTEANAVESRGTRPSVTYKQWLGKMVDEVKAKGAIPVLVAPVCRSYFSNGKIRRNGRHDLGDSFSLLTADGIKEKQSLPATDHTMDYVYHMQQLAKEKGVEFVDLTSATAALYESYGDAKCHEQLFDGEGSTHFNTTGALLVARLCAQLMKEQGILADAINVPTDLSISPEKADMGQAYKGQTLTKELTLNGFGLAPETGTIHLSGSEGVELSADKQTWASTLDIEYMNGTLVKNFYARVTLATVGAFAGIITARSNAKSIEVPLSANAIDLGDGTPVKAFWPLLTSADCTTEGPITALDEQWSGMTVKDYAPLKSGATSWSTGATTDNNRKTQRNDILGSSWAKAEDDDPERYIAFAVQAPQGQTLKISDISMFVGGAGGSGMMCHVYYSTDNFKTRTTIFAPTSMAGNTMYEVKAQPVVTLHEGQTLQVRVYPWYNANATGKTICLADVCISGQAEAQALENEPVSITFPFHEGKEGQTATFGPDDKANAYFKTSYVQVGSSLTYKGVSNIAQQTLFQPTQQDGSANDGNAILFCFMPKKGLVFTPTKISFKTTRYGTDGGKVDATWIAANGTTTSLKKAINPNRDNSTPNVTQVAENIAGAEPSDGLCTLRLNLYSLGNTKQVGFSDIVIEGTLIGSPQNVKQCRLNASLSDAKAATLSITPSATLFDEGDAVTLSVAENFGYHFSAWVDADGNEVSRENPYTFNITDDTTLRATFKQMNTYALNIALTDGARPNLVQIQPEGYIDADGRRLYEEGDEVRLTPLDNHILTFTRWEDGSTEGERTIRMDGEKNLTAHFAAADYIVGWDFYYDQPNKDRAADFASDSENAGQLSLRNAAGNTMSWLTRGINNGAESGRWGARIWRPRADGWYFEASFSTRGYKNVRVSSSLGCSYNTYSTIHLQYSTNGTDFTTIDTFNFTDRGWVDHADVSLPADADEQPRLWIRWMPDRSSSLVGAASDNDGLCISDVFVTADAGTQADHPAILVSTNPAQGATDAPANGAVILNFDSKIALGNGAKALLDGKELSPIVTGKSAIFRYNGLEYATAYTFSLPEGALQSSSGKPVEAINIGFTTIDRQQPQARLYDAVVAQDGTGDYTTLQAAIDHAPANRATPWLVFVKNGRYNEHVNIPTTKPFIHIIGQDRDKTVVLDDKLCGGDNALHVSEGATVVVWSSNCFFENITLENSYGHELQKGPQALALNTMGDRIVLNNVALLSYQDTWITTSTSNYRHYIKNSLIEGAVDFIYNSGNVYLDADTLEINRPSGGYIVAPSHADDVKWGYVFQNCIIRPHKGINVTDVWLGRPWHNQPKTVFINTQTFVNLPAKGWFETMGGLPSLWADYNTVDAKGNPLDLSQRQDTYYYTDKTTGQKVYGKAKNFLTDEEAAQYTIRNVLGGDDNWKPELMCEACQAPTLSVDGARLTWPAVPYAICYVVTKNGQVVDFTTLTSCDYTEGDTWQVQAVNEFGGLSAKATIGQSSAINALQTDGNGLSQRLFAADGRRLSTFVRGLNIVRQSDGTTLKMMR